MSALPTHEELATLGARYKAAKEAIEADKELVVNIAKLVLERERQIGLVKGTVRPAEVSGPRVVQPDEFRIYPGSLYWSQSEYRFGDEMTWEWELSLDEWPFDVWKYAARTDELVAKAAEERRALEEAEAARKAEIKAAQDRAQEARERAQYERLKAKFEGTP